MECQNRIDEEGGLNFSSGFFRMEIEIWVVTSARENAEWKYMYTQTKGNFPFKTYWYYCTAINLVAEKPFSVIATKIHLKKNKFFLSPLPQLMSLFNSRKAKTSMYTFPKNEFVHQKIAIQFIARIRTLKNSRMVILKRSIEDSWRFQRARELISQTLGR